MRRLLAALLAAAACVTPVAPWGAAAQGFHPPCESQLPFQLRTLKKLNPIDTSCDLDGDGSAASRLQNAAKNNFCAAGSPTRVTHTTFLRLHEKISDRLAAMGISWGTPTAIPSSRGMLAGVHTVSGVPMGEGSVVRYVGYVLEAHHSNVSNGEKVNCNETGKLNNDIHVALGPARDTAPCDSVTAEISPHFRPDVWNDFDQYWFYNPVRLTGQLFFDASHKPCTPGQPRNPKRLSSWEIHPVYSIDVCKNTSLGGCPANDESKWIPFHEWAELPDDEGR